MVQLELLFFVLVLDLTGRLAEEGSIFCRNVMLV